VFNGVTVADTRRALRVLETSSPPVYYVPSSDVAMNHLVPTRTHTLCEWKGAAAYYSVVVGDRVAPDAAWTYPRPSPGFEAIRDHVAFYPARVDACFVDEEQARPVPGDYYGGWVTADIVGPFKGAPGTESW
jgi:uncharacterized protein (DUF427 family)